MRLQLRRAQPCATGDPSARLVDTYRLCHPYGGAGADQELGAPGPTVTQRIDYVFVRAKSALRPAAVAEFMNVPEPSTVEPSGVLWPSDHWGVIATLR